MTDDHQELFSGRKPFTLGAATHSRGGRGAASPGSTAQPTLPSVLRGSPSPSPRPFWPAAAGHRSDCSPQHLPPGPSGAYLPQGAARSLPAVPGLPREQGHAGTASPCPGHARKLCLTLHSAAQPPGTKNRSCARLDVFLSAGYTPSCRSIFSIGGAAGCRLEPRVVFHGPARRDAGQPPGNTP